MRLLRLLQAFRSSEDDALFVAFDCDRNGNAIFAVPHDDSEVVRHAAPLDDRARGILREQYLATLERDPQAVAERDLRIAIERGRVTPIRRRA